MNFKKTYVPRNGYTPLCQIGSCSLKDLEFGMIELTEGQTLSYDTQEKETGLCHPGRHGRLFRRWSGLWPSGRPLQRVCKPQSRMLLRRPPHPR